MECEEHLEILIRNRFHLVQSLQVDRPFLMDYLLSKNVFDRNDYDRVRSEKTREEKACKVLDILETKGENGFKHFKDALQLINPNLYETLTGEKATYRDSPIIETMGLVGNGNRLIDQDILSSHLKRVTDDLRDMTLRYNTLLKEDQQLHKALETSRCEKDVLESRLEFLEQQLEETEAAASETYNNASKSLFTQYEAMQRDRNENKDFIIQLQMRILQSTEETEKRTRELEECKAKCEDLEHQLSKVNENYIFQRSETIKLSAKLKTRTEEAKQYENLKHQWREKQFQVVELKSSMEDKTKELEDIKNWAEALKNRYDTVVEERNETLVKQRTTVESLTHSQNNNTDLKIKLNRMTREITELKKERAKLDKEIAILRNQTKTQNEAYLKATEKIEETKAYFKDILKSKEKELNEKKELADHYQNEVDELKREIRKSKDELDLTLKKNDELLSQLSKLRTEFDMTVETLEEEISKWEERYGNDIEELEQDPTCTKENNDDDVSDKNDGTVYNWKKRATSDLVQSIRKRFTKAPETTSVKPEDKRELFRKSLSFDSWLENIVPAYNGLSLKSKETFSLEGTYRRKPMQPLPYATLAHMYSEGATTEFFPYRLKTSLRGATSLPFYDKKTKDQRKSSSPLPLSKCDPLLLHHLREYAGEKWKEDERESNRACQAEESNDVCDDTDSSTSITKTSIEWDNNNNNNNSDNISLLSGKKKVIPFRPRSQAITSSIISTEQSHLTHYLGSSTATSSSYDDKMTEEQD